MKFWPIVPLAVCLLGIGPTPAGAGDGVTLTNLVSFTGIGGACPGAGPRCGLVLGPDGDFYGTTAAGGAYNEGTIFRLTLSDVFTNLYSFDGTNGATPYAALAPGTDGALYGTTCFGGPSNWGTIFRITTNGVLTSLYAFTNSHLGANPAAALISDGRGGFYGTANYGGSTNASYQGFGYGTVFHWASDGTVTAPVVFANTNGAYPDGGLIWGKDGNFYGTTAFGGAGISPSFQGYGTLFRVKPDGTLATLEWLDGSDQGGFAYAGLAQGRDGRLYGAAFNGGSVGNGTLFSLSTNGAFRLLHTFGFFESGAPYGRLTEGSDGNLYGTTLGAFGGNGAIYRLTPAGDFTNLISFNGGNGAHPRGALLQGPDGKFYGTTSQGGANGQGGVFQLAVPLAPVVKSISLSNGVVTFTWRAVAGQIYQVQYATDLMQSNWASLTKPVIAPFGTMTNRDAVNPAAPQRFYRVVLQ